MSREEAFYILVVALLITASAIDYKNHRIPNWLTLLLVILGLSFHATDLNVYQIGSALSGLLLGFILFLPFYIKGGMGAGDVKLMAAIGSCTGIPLSIYAVLYSLISGGLIALAYIFYIKSTRTVESTDSQTQVMSNIRKQHFPYALAIASGTMMSLYQFEKLWLLN